VQDLLRPMLFVCDSPAYRDTLVTFVYTVLDLPDQQPQEHSVKFGAGLLQLTKMRRQITPVWLVTTTHFTADQCASSNSTSLVDVLRQRRQQPVVGNFTTFSFNVTGTYEVRFSLTADVHI